MADSNCAFCKIVAGEIPARRVYEDDAVLAFEDVNPQAPTHVLVVPKEHLRDLPAVAAAPQAPVGYLAGIAATAERLGLTDFRTVFNTGAAVGQSVWHVHAHLLAGRPMGWPPG
jgi:histidine triad (HIT) family protein